jgi:hypothetical protein
MNKRFLLATEPTPGHDAAVFATSHVNPLEALEDVERELADRKVKGKVVFDLLLTNGHKLNRYFVGVFDGQHFRDSKFSPVQAEYADLSRASAQFLKGHFEEVSTSLLTPAMRYAIKTGIPF